MSPTLPTVADLVQSIRRRVRRDSTVAIAAVILAAVPFVLIAAWLLSGWSGWASPSPAPLILDAAVILGIIAFLIFAGQWLARRTTEREMAAAAEGGAGLPPGSLRGLLELGREVPSGTSAALVRRAETRLGQRLAGRSTSEISGEAGRTARQRRTGAVAVLAAACATAIGLALLSPERGRASWPALTRPLAHLGGPALPALTVHPGDVSVPRGAEIAVRVRAPGRIAVTVHHRAEGDVPHRETVTVSADTAVVRFMVDARTSYWVEAPDGATSARFTASPLDPLLVSELALEVRYPDYVSRPPERYETDLPAIVVPEGAVLAVSGQTTLPLAEAALVIDGTELGLQVDGDRFAGAWTPARSGVYDWILESAYAGGRSTLPPPIDVTVVADDAPLVAMTFPARDTVFDASRVQPVAADAADDFGVAAATLVSWRIGPGGRSPAVETPIPIANAETNVFVRGVLDASEMELLPGDTVRYFVRVTDNSPRSQTAVTATYAFYVPGRPELRDLAEEQVDQAVAEAEDLANSARELQDATRDLQRRTQANRARNEANRNAVGQNRTGEEGSLGFSESEQARQVLEQQEELAARLDEMRQRLEAMERALEEAGLEDPQLEKELAELRELYDEMLTPELQQQIEDLREALEDLDPEQLQKALDELAARQQEIREQLRESLEQLRKAATDEQINALAQEARELATQQAAVAETMRNGQAGAEQVERQRQLERRAGELQESVAEMSRQLQGQDQQAAESTENAGARIQQAREQMEDAADQAQRGGQEAAEQGDQAARNLEQAARDLDAARNTTAENARQQLNEAMEQALRDAQSLAQRQEELRQQMEQAQQSGQRGQQAQQGQAGNEQMRQMRDQQSELQQQLDKLNQDLAQTSDQSGQVSREVGTEMGRAGASMERTTQAMQRAGQQQGMPTEQAAETVQALERLAQAIERNVQQLGQDQASSSEQTRQELGEIAREQGQLAGRTNALLPLGLNPQDLARQTGRMAQDQRRIAQRIEQLDEQGMSQDDILGRLDEMAAEAERLAQALAGGRPPAEVLARQERLFHRLLDAGRSLEKEEFSEKRVGERPGAWTPTAPGPLDPALLRAGDRYRLPTAAELRALPPAYRKLVLEYFGRINRSTTRQRSR